MEFEVSVISLKGSERLQSIDERLSGNGFNNYKVYFGKETTKRFDGLYENIKTIIADHYSAPFSILVEDDILPTIHFTPSNLKKILSEAEKLHPDIILGGIKQASLLSPAAPGLFSVHNFRGSQLMIIFEKFYDRILKAPLDQEFEIFCSYHDNIRKMVTVPFFAYQINSPSRFLPYTHHQKDYMDCENQIRKVFGQVLSGEK